ncbi:MAG: response regulator [Myxococcota bacterium]
MRHYLIVDDNKAFAENLADILLDGGAKATIATSGTEALEIAARTRFDALLSDMRMPGMDGAELVHRMRRIDPGLPAIVATAYTSDDDLTRARAEGLLAVLPKPLPIPALLTLLTQARRDGLVALIEDDLALADNISELLRDRGFSTVTATSVLETEQLSSVKPFAALVDMRIPGGADGVAMLRLASRYPGLPIIVMTAYPDARPPVETQAYLPKPFNTALLIETVERQYRAAIS